MEKTLKLGNEEIVIRASTAVLIYYKEQFGTEYMDDQKELKSTGDDNKAVLMGGQLIWAMAKAADENIKPPQEFYEEIGNFDLERAMIEAAELFDKSCQGVNNISNNGRSELTSEGIVSAALSCKMSLNDLNKLSLAMTINIIDEYCAMRNGEEGYRQATQEDFDNL